MALIQCEDCGGKVSSIAGSCPHCGRPGDLIGRFSGAEVPAAVPDGARVCVACQREVAWKRKIGVGTLLLVLMTFGFWLLLIPLYPKRCPICLGTAFSCQHEVTAGAC